MADRSGKLQSSTLEAILSAGSDVTLLLDNNETAQGHFLTLTQWSGVLGSLLDGCGNSGSSSSSSRDAPDNSACTARSCRSTASNISIPMPGTEKRDWLTVMTFVYPVVPQPRVSWDNLEVLLTIGNKYDMPALLCKAGMFLQDNKQQLTSSCDHQLFAWKWITLADKAGLPSVAQACITSCFEGQQAAALMDACKKEVLLGMSPATCWHVVEAVTQHKSAALQPGMVYCSNCKCHRQMRSAASHTMYAVPAPGLLRCQVCLTDTVFSYNA